jgi:site-specific DNA-methyltransferase (adenine-specific)/modification methylase
MKNPKSKRREIRRLADLRPHPANPNRHTERGSGMMENSLRQCGFGDSLTVDKDGVVISGNQRLETLADIQMENPIVVQSDGSRPIVHQRTDLSIKDKRARMLSIYQNRVAELNLEWSPEILKSLAEDVDLGRFWTEKELTLLIPDLEVTEGPAPQLDKAAELQKKWKVKRGQIWEIPSKTAVGKCHHLMCGDCLEMLVKVPRIGVELLLSDPPYGIALKTDFDKLPAGGKTYQSIIGDDKPFDPRPFLWPPKIILWGGNHFHSLLPEKGRWLVWAKRAPEDKPDHYFGDCEIAWSNLPGPARLMHLRWAEAEEGAASRNHPTHKPVQLIRWCIEQAEIEGVILDPFLGSGTTMIAAEQLGRICYGMEIDPPYVSVALQRMEDMDLHPKLVSSGAKS